MNKNSKTEPHFQTYAVSSCIAQSTPFVFMYTDVLYVLRIDDSMLIQTLAQSQADDPEVNEGCPRL
jgi:hypothetical protein